MQPASVLDEDPGVDGPDYVAVVIKWDQQPENAARMARATAAISDELLLPPQRSARGRAIATVLGALGVLALMYWGLRRLRA